MKVWIAIIRHSISQIWLSMTIKNIPQNFFYWNHRLLFISLWRHGLGANLLSKVIEPGEIILELCLPYELETGRDFHSEDRSLLRVDEPVQEMAKASVVDGRVLTQISKKIQ